MLPGPFADTWGRASVLSGDGRGTGWEVEQERRNGTVVDAAPGDAIALGSDVFTISLDPRGYVVLTCPT